MTGADFKPLPAPHDAIDVKANRYDWGFCIEYRGPSLAALLAAGCITQFMVDQLSDPRGRNDPRGRVDAEGARFRLSKRPTKSEPDRCVLCRWIHFDKGGSAAKALTLPGMAAYLDVQSAPESTQPRIKTGARGIAKVLGATDAQERTRAVGRFRRVVSWVTVGGIVCPDWPTIRACALASRSAHP